MSHVPVINNGPRCVYNAQGELMCNRNTHNLDAYGHTFEPFAQSSGGFMDDAMAMVSQEVPAPMQALRRGKAIMQEIGEEIRDEGANTVKNISNQVSDLKKTLSALRNMNNN